MAELIGKPARWVPGLRDGHPPARDLAARWPYWERQGGKLYDVANPFDIANHGTLTNGPTWTGAALDFDGTDDYVRIPYHSNIDCSDSTAFSVSVLFHFGGAFFDGALISHFTNTPSNFSGWMLWLNQAGDDVRFYINGAIRSEVSMSGMAVGWYQVTAVWTGTQTRVYLDGTLIDEDSYSTAPANGAADLLMGGYYNEGNDDGGIPDQRFDDQIGDISLWKNRALSASEIAEHAADPWGLITPRIRTYSFVTAAAVARRRIPPMEYYYRRRRAG